MTHKITREYEKKMSEISPFELKNILIDLADESARKSTHIMLNAGRGNPNWISTVPREAFFLLGQFGLEECARSSEYGEEMVGLAGIPEKKRIATRFTQFLMKHAGSPGMALLKDTYDYLVLRQNCNFLNMGICHVAQGKIDASITSCNRHRCNRPLVRQFSHAVVISAGQNNSNCSHACSPSFALMICPLSRIPPG